MDVCKEYAFDPIMAIPATASSRQSHLCSILYSAGTWQSPLAGKVACIEIVAGNSAQKKIDSDAEPGDSSRLNTINGTWSPSTLFIGI